MLPAASRLFTTKRGSTALSLRLLLDEQDPVVAQHSVGRRVVVKALLLPQA
jgi:hypothetical protein